MFGTLLTLPRRLIGFDMAGPHLGPGGIRCRLFGLLSEIGLPGYHLCEIG